MISELTKQVIKQIKITSTQPCIAYPPNPNDEIEQNLTIDRQGEVWFSGYAYGNGCEHSRIEEMQFSIGREQAEKIMDGIRQCFLESGYQVWEGTDCGEWTLEVTMDDGTVQMFSGSLCAEYKHLGEDLSDMIRETLRIRDLFVFDGNINKMQITHVDLEYRRRNSRERDQGSGTNQDQQGEDYAEKLTIDRKSGSICFVRRPNSSGKIIHTYECAEDVEFLLDGWEGIDLTVKEERTESDQRDYRITIQYRNHPEEKIEGYYNQNGLPGEFSDFIEEVKTLLEDCDRGEIFAYTEQGAQGKRKFCEGEVTLCSVSFDGGYSTYFYRMSDDLIRVGDRVIVPVGPENKHLGATVVSVDYFAPDDVPMPLEQVKTIVRRCSEKDYPPPVSLQSDDRRIEGNRPQQ